MTFHPDSLPDLTGRVYVVTGGNSGIGLYTVARLAQHGAHVYMCARSTSKGSAAMATIKSIYPQANIALLEIDHMSLSSVVSAAKSISSKESQLHGLINNAGIMATPPQTGKDGHEAQWQTNYLAHWVFTFHLLPLLLRTSRALPGGTVRIVNVTSGGHFFAPKGGINFADTSLPDKDGMARYGQSKLANVLHAKNLNKQYGPGSPSAKSGKGEIWTSSVHPGLVETNLTTTSEMGTLVKSLIWGASLLGGRFDADKGAWTSVFCAASPEMKKEQSGTYFERIAKSGWQSSNAKDTALATKLEEWTKKEMEKQGWC